MKIVWEKERPISCLATSMKLLIGTSRAAERSISIKHSRCFKGTEKVAAFGKEIIDGTVMEPQKTDFIGIPAFV